MALDTARQVFDIVVGPFGSLFLMGLFLWLYDNRAQKREEAERESRDRLASTFETTVKNILEKSEAHQELLLTKAENAERLCEARYETLLKEVLRGKI